MIDADRRYREHLNPATAITFDEPLTEAEAEDFKQRWSEHHARQAGTTHRVLELRPPRRKRRISPLQLAAGTALGIGLATWTYLALGWITVTLR